MKVLTRYRRLNLWNKLGVWGAITSVVGLAVSFGTMFWRNGPAEKLSVEPTPPKQSAALATNPIRESSALATNPIRESSAREVLRYLEKLPPLQRQVVESSSYIGRRVDWRGQLQDVVRIGEGFQLSLSEEDGGSPWTFVRFDVGWRQQLDNLRKGDTIAFEGNISDIGTVAIVDGSKISVEAAQ